jgi:sulfofructose kinase
VKPKAYDVLGLGAVAVDDMLFVDEFPLPDTKTPVQRKERAVGGLAGAALVAAACLGARAAYFGILDQTDALARIVLDELDRYGVDCGHVLHKTGAKPIHAVVIIVQGQGSRSILFSHEGVCEPDPAQIPEELIASARVLFVDHTVPRAAVHAASIARRHGIPVVADVEAAAFPEQEAFLGSVDHLILGLDLARRLTGERAPAEVISALLPYGLRAVVLTGGENGCWYGTPVQAPLHQPALNVQAVDTTGCGDVFHGAYCACLAWGGDIPHALRIATAAAGLKATRTGGLAGIPRGDEVEKCLGQMPPARSDRW